MRKSQFFMAKIPVLIMDLLGKRPLSARLLKGVGIKFPQVQTGEFIFHSRWMGAAQHQNVSTSAESVSQ